MPYIPNYNKLSLQELAYAPSLMRQQHDEAVANQIALEEAMKFDYLNQDEEVIAPRLQKYSQGIEDVSKDLVSRGFNHGLKDKIVNLQREYSGDEQIRKVRKNYSDAMSGWEDMKKASIQRGATGDMLNKFKKAYFGSYQGAYDPEGTYREFTPGAISGVYDIAEETKKAMTNIGKTGSVVGSSGSSIKFKPATATTPAYYEVYDSKTGQLIKNTDQIAAVKQYMKSEFDPENQQSDRGLFSRLMGYDTNYINSLVDQVGGSMTENYYQQLPQSSKNFGMMPTGRGSDEETPYNNQEFRTYTDKVVNSDRYRAAEEALKNLKDPKYSGGRKTKVDVDAGSTGTAFNPFVRLSGDEITSTPSKSEIEDGWISKYPLLSGAMGYDINNPKDKRQVAEMALTTEMNNSAWTSKKTDLNLDPKKSLSANYSGAVDFILSNIDSDVWGDKSLLIKENTGLFKNNDFTKADFEKSFSDNKSLADGRAVVFNDGTIKLYNDKGDRFVLNTGAMSEQFKNAYNNALVPVLNQLRDEKLFEPDINGDSKVKPIRLDNDPLQRTFIVAPPLRRSSKYNPYDVSDRTILSVLPDGTIMHEYGQEEFMNEMLTGTILSGKNVIINN